MTNNYIKRCLTPCYTKCNCANCANKVISIQLLDWPKLETIKRDITMLRNRNSLSFLEEMQNGTALWEQFEIFFFK